MLIPSVCHFAICVQVADEHLERLSLYYTIYGVVFGIVGVAAIVVPIFFKFPIDELIAWLLVVGGGVTLLQFILVCGAPGTTAFLLLGALHLSVGLWMLLHPVPNPTMLIFLIAGWFLIHVSSRFQYPCFKSTAIMLVCRTCPRFDIEVL